MRRCVEEHDRKDVQVPHAVDSGEEGAVYLHRVLSPVPVALIHLDNKTNKQMLTLVLVLVPTEEGNTSHFITLSMRLT